MNTPIIIREAKKYDAPQLLSLFEKHAEYEGNSLLSTKQATSDKLNILKNLSDTPLIILVVVQGTEIKGYMSLLKQFSTWDMNYYLYMDCLYLLPELRGEGMGKLLMEHCKSYSHQHKLLEIQWQTPVENSKAINFYKHIGARSKAKLRFFWE
ncbi:GNAT family N-acetyltransferase [Pseudocolwellia sp. AS88]|uniref:GNAT family N-acetyltransferase n=1 Tax=Pseudocolwellia sp. AS88 TaxID=3063958 RepID=UPI0026F13B68|nr:GNAT family N-acetyltransferase [Pseudocolwellia sp. AS88]MDO7083578.1 GNAT family N-acetyltransferase [Pseudocolwellia sp. AS88]